MTQALAKYGVRPQRSRETVQAVTDVLRLANKYRTRLVAIHQEEYNAVTDFRDKHYPEVYRAWYEYEVQWHRIGMLERQIKQYHSDVRDRNAVTNEMRRELEQEREERTRRKQRLDAERERWNRYLRAFAAAKNAAADWKNVKSLDKRREMYAAINWNEALRQARMVVEAEMRSSDEKRAAKAAKRYEQIDWDADLQEYAQLWMTHDLQRRELDAEYQERGLHWATRNEIKDTSRPKLKKYAPGIRYRYGRPPEIEPWQKLTVQIPGGLTVENALAGRHSQLRLERVGRDGLCRVRQRIGGSARVPVTAEYTVRLHRPLQSTDIIQRWSLVVEACEVPEAGLEHHGKRPSYPWYCTPIIKNRAPNKPQRSGVLTYSLRWTRRAGGVEVAHFESEHVNESLVIPEWIINERMGVSHTQERCDQQANELLRQRGLKISQQPGPKTVHGLERLRQWIRDNPGDAEAVNLARELSRAMHIAWRDARRAERRITKIYETVVSRVCRLHDRIVPDKLDLSRIKRYDTRDLLREDRLPPPSREYLHAVAIGKLRAKLLDYGLASVEAAPEDREVARETDVFSSYVDSLGRRQSDRGANRAGTRNVSSGTGEDNGL